MIYKDRKHLAIIELQEERSTLSYEELYQALAKRPSLAVYVEVKGLLYGIVTLGRIQRSYLNHQEQVGISTKFTFLGPNEFMKAREIFRSGEVQEKQHIVVLPVVSPDGELLGCYSIYNDLLLLEYSLTLLARLNTDEFVKCGFRLALVRPASDSPKKLRLYLKAKKVLEAKGILMKTLDFHQALDCSLPFDYVVFCDVEECVTVNNLRHISGKNHQAIFFTYEMLRDFLYCDARRVLKMLQEKGVFVLTYDFEEDGSKYLTKIFVEMENRRRQKGWKRAVIPAPEMRKEFFLEFYESFADQELPIPLTSCIQDGVISVRDMSSPVAHVEHGRRRTIGQPERYERCIYVAGPCMAAGAYVDDRHTIPSLLQEKINRAGLKCKVENYGVNVGEKIVLYLNMLLSAPLAQGDIVVFDKGGLCFSGIPNLNLTNALERCQAPVTWFVEDVRHCNHKATRIFAEAIFEELLPVLRQPAGSRQLIEKDSEPIGELYLNQYFVGFDASAYETVGSIVMNCNPFTLGHRYLIEEALKQVGFLIIFVVEEEGSWLSFMERFSMVCAGTADLNRVMVVPSGKFILSRLTFPEYFVKETDEQLKENTENDITLFAKKIAPALGITHRFVGEEPEDQVTNAYNQTMKRILPAYGVQLVEIPRKRNGQEVISASRVRKCLEENDLDQLDTLVPESTKKILFYEGE